MSHPGEWLSSKSAGNNVEKVKPTYIVDDNIKWGIHFENSPEIP